MGQNKPQIAKFSRLCRAIAIVSAPCLRLHRKMTHTIFNKQLHGCDRNCSTVATSSRLDSITVTKILYSCNFIKGLDSIQGHGRLKVATSPRAILRSWSSLLHDRNRCDSQLQLRSFAIVGRGCSKSRLCASFLRNFLISCPNCLLFI